MPYRTDLGYNITIIGLLFIHFGLLSFWVVVRSGYLQNNPSIPQGLPGQEQVKVFFTWLGFGLQLCVCDSTHRIRIIANGVFATLLLALYVAYMALGTTMGVGEVCRGNVGLCFYDHFITFMALVIVGMIGFDVVRSAIWLNNWSWPKPRPVRPVPAPTRPIPPPAPRPAPAPAPLTPQPKPEQQKKALEQDQQSVISFSTTLQGEETQDKKKRHSTITIYSVDEHELGPLPEQIIVPNPNSGNPGSTPNKGLGQYLQDNPSIPQGFPQLEYVKVSSAWIGFGLQLCLGETMHRIRIIVNGVFATLLLAQYVAYMTLGTTMGVGEVCRGNVGLCFYDHFITSMALLIVGVIGFDVAYSAIWLDKWGWPKPRPVRPIQLPALRPDPAPAPAPLTPQPKPEQQEKAREQDRQSMESSATTLQEEKAETDKDKKKHHSTITIYSMDEHELDPLPEQTIVPNPTSGNPESTPNKGL
ncbi:hypothetical protein BGW39_007974 [Mortierella sp. 14UC]|nr:hypothetical protein BGW39_007974 [Mortierella sp. 14UC]